MFSFPSSDEGSPHYGARLWRIELKLELILKHLGIPYDGTVSWLPAEVRALADQGKKIEAIK